jgi:hypothetical protein
MHVRRVGVGLPGMAMLADIPIKSESVVLAQLFHVKHKALRDAAMAEKGASR